MTTPDHINRAAQAISLAPWADLSITEQVRWLNAAGRLAEAGLLATPAHDAAVAAKAWDEGFKQGGPMHDVHLDDPDAHTRNPYREGSRDA